MVFFSADYHLCHNNIVNLCNRPWLPEENNDRVVEAHNSVVSPGDTVYLLGDTCWSKNIEVWQDFCRRLNGNLIFLPGNHDKLYHNCRLELEYENEWVVYRDRERECYFADNGNSLHQVVLDKIVLVLFHYPMLSWNGWNRGSVHLFGHCHGNMDDKVSGRCFDVGIDSAKCGHKPVSLTQVKEWLKDV